MITRTLRRLEQQPLFALSVVACMALGVGAVSAILALVHNVLLRPLPYPDGEDLVVIEERTAVDDPISLVSVPSFTDLKELPAPFEAVAAFGAEDMVVTGLQRPRKVAGGRVSDEWFSAVLKIEAAHGRVFGPRDPLASVVLGNGFWRSELNADPEVVGTTLVVDDQPCVVLGVLPDDFRFEGFGNGPLRSVEIWRPLDLEPYRAFGRGVRFLEVLGRRRATAAARTAADAVLQATAARAREGEPALPDTWGYRAVPLRENLVAPVRLELALLLTGVSLLFLVAAGNITNLFLVRAVRQRRDLAVRLALGGRRDHVLRVVVGEAVFLAVPGGVLGTALGWALAHWLVARSPVDLPRLAVADLTGSVCLLATLATLALLLLSLLPAVPGVLRHVTMTELQEGGRGGESRHRGRLRSGVVLAEIALATALITSAGLLVRSFWMLQQVDLGFEPSGTLSLRLDLPRSRYLEPARVSDFFDRLEERVTSLPSVTAVGVIKDLPLSGRTTTAPLSAPDSAVFDTPRMAAIRPVSPGYFPAAGLRRVAGTWPAVTSPSGHRSGASGASDFSWMVVNHRLATELWPGESPLGRTLTVQWFGRPVAGTVTGVVADTRHARVDEPGLPAVYLDHRRLHQGSLYLVARSDLRAERLLPSIRGLVAEMDPDLPVSEVATLDQRVADSRSQAFFLATVLSGFAVLAVILASVGLYGAVAYDVSLQKRHLAIRMVLGASPRKVLGQVLGRVLAIAVGGLGIGLLMTLAAGNALARLLYVIPGRDPLSLLTPALALIAVALLAGYLPARRILSLEPNVALNQE